MWGQKVILNGGALVFPVLHDIIWVNLNTLKLIIEKKDDMALITKDRMRVDVVAEFYLRVDPEDQSVANAAQTLGERTLNTNELKALMEGKFVDALRSVASEMAMEELHEQRSEFVQKVQNAVTNDLKKNGLQLETVSLTGLDQTDIQFFNENNAFDAEGMTRLKETIETRKKDRNDIEQDNKVAIEQKNLEAEQKSLEIGKEKEFASLAQQREIESQKARQQASIAEEQAAQKKLAEEAKIASDQSIETQRIKAEQAVTEESLRKEQAVEAQAIRKEKAVEIENQERDIAIAEKSEEQSKAKASAEVARAEAVKAQEQVATAKATEIANRDKSIAVIKAKEGAESEAAKILVKAEAEKKAAQDKADAVKTEATGRADAITIQANADERRYAVEAEGKEALNNAENQLDDRIIQMRIKSETIQQMSSIVEASVKPIEKLKDMKVVSLSGFQGNNGHVSAGGGGDASSKGFTADLMEQLLSYRMQKPLVDNLLKDAGLGEGGLEDLITNIDKIDPSVIQTAVKKLSDGTKPAKTVKQTLPPRPSSPVEGV